MIHSIRIALPLVLSAALLPAAAHAGELPPMDLSVIGQLNPGVGTGEQGELAYRDFAASGGYGVRAEAGLHPWWAVGLAFRSRYWKAAVPGLQQVVDFSGSSVVVRPNDGEAAGRLSDLSASVRFRPFHFQLPSGSLELGAILSAGWVIGGNLDIATLPSDFPEGRDVWREDVPSGLTVGGGLAAHYFPVPWAGAFVEAGLDWYRTGKTRGEEQFELSTCVVGTCAQGRRGPPLFSTQGSVSLGAVVRF